MGVAVQERDHVFSEVDRGRGARVDVAAGVDVVAVRVVGGAGGAASSGTFAVRLGSRGG